MITIHTVNGTKYFGVYDNSGNWSQATSENLATAIAVLDEIPTIAGSYKGTVYGDGEEHTPNNTVTVTGRPFRPVTETGTITTESDATDVSATVTITGVNQFDIAYQDKTDYHKYIFGFLR
jgi:hypothetical protein